MFNDNKKYHHTMFKLCIYAVGNEYRVEALNHFIEKSINLTVYIISMKKNKTKQQHQQQEKENFYDNYI